MDNKNMVDFSLVMLCYRSESLILDFARSAKNHLKSFSDSFEIVLVGNYIENSDDQTEKYIRKLEQEDPIFRGICKPKKGMMGWDMREGLNFARGKYLCVIDGDGQFPIESISKCYSVIKTGKYGLVKTYRSTRGDGFYRRLISFVFNTLFSLLYPNIKSKDVNSKPKTFTRECYEKLDLKSDDWFIDAEIMIQIGKLGIPYYEFPLEFLKLEGRQSFVKPEAIFEFLKNLIKSRFK